MLDLRQTTRCAKFVLVVVISVLGCSRQMAEPMAETPSPEAKVAGKGESAEAAAPVAAQSSNPQAVFGRRIAQLSSEAAGHERRGYFDSAIAARQEIVRLFAERSGPEAWETRSAEEALERTMRLGKLTPQERATCDAAEGRERQAYQLWKQNRAGCDHGTCRSTPPGGACVGAKQLRRGEYARSAGALAARRGRPGQRRGIVSPGACDSRKNFLSRSS